MQFFDPETGAPVKVEDPALAAKLIGSGKIGFKSPDEKVPVVFPDGRRGTVPAANINSALAKGFRLQSLQEEGQGQARKDFENPLGYFETGSVGALRSLTGGASDFLAQKFSDDPAQTKREMNEMKDANPGVNATGEVVGTAAGLALGAGAPGLAAKAGAAAKAATGTGAVARAVGMATEGGIYGLGQAVSESALDDEPGIAGEKLFAGAAGGMLAGGGMSLLGDGVIAGGKAIMQRFGGQGLRELLNEHANNFAIRQFTRLRELRNEGLTPDEIQTIGQYGLENNLFAPGASATKERALAAKADLWANRVAPHLDNADQLAGREGGFNVERVTSRAQQELIDPMNGNPALAPVRNQLQGFVKEYQRYGPGGDLGPMSFQRAWELQRSLREKTGMGEANFGIKKELQNLRQIFREEIFNHADELNPGIGAALKAGSREYRNAAVIANIATSAEQRSFANRLTSPSDMLFGLGGMAALGPKGLALGAANHVAREYGGSFVAQAMHGLANGSALDRLGTGLKKMVDAGLRGSESFGGVFRAQLERAASTGAMDLLATHVKLAQQNPDYLASVGLADETPEAASDYAVKSDQLSGVASALQAHDAGVERSLNRVFGRQSGRPPKADRQSLTKPEYAQVFSRLEDLATHPQVLVQAANTGGLGDVAPGTAAAMAATAARAVNYLYATAPKNPGRNPIAALDLKWEPSDLDMMRWSRRADAIQNPSQVLSELENGTLTSEHVDAVRNVYPQLFQKLQARLMERLQDTKGALSIPQRTMISRLFGAPIGQIGDPERVALIQDMHKATMQPPDQGAATGGDGRQKVDTVANYQTQSQRIEARG
jgi:hypothetical protein